MTVKLLDEIILAADTEKCAAFFETMTEPQRKALSARALQWASAIRGFHYRARERYHMLDEGIAKDVEFYESVQAQKVEFPMQFTGTSSSVVRMAVLATCGLPEIKRLDMLGIPDARLAARILIARKPGWLDKWCIYVLKEFPASHWLALYELEKSGVCAIERSANYWVAMACGLPHSEGMYQHSLSQDERLRNELWEMLADPGVMRVLAEPEQVSHENVGRRWRSGGDIFASRQTGGRKGTELWRQALVKLASEGLIDSNRLIEYSFMSLSRTAESPAKKSYYQHVSTADFAIKLNQDLTKENIASYASQFASLLGATHQDVSTYASSVLIDLPEGALSVAEICSCIAPAFLNKSKEPADAALKLLNRLSKEHPAERSQYGPAILSAFNHSSKDIHKKALALIESSKMLQDQNLLSEFQQRMDMLAGLERTNAAKLATQYQNSQSTECDTVPVPINIGSADELYKRAGELDPTLRALARIDDAIEAIKKDIYLDAPVSLDTLKFPRLNPHAAVKPIANLDDLVYMFTKVWSGNSNAMELEAVLDGLSRLCHERPHDFQEKTDVLRQKAQKIAEESPVNLWIGSLAHLAFYWLGPPSDPAGSTAFFEQGSLVGGFNLRLPTIPTEANTFFAHRCLAVAKRAAAKQSAPLLAAPTHAGGWIDPVILVKRLLEYSRINLEPEKCDFIQALLRLAPDHRAAALESAGSIKGEIGNVLRFLLGAGTMADIQTPEYWVAAFRARDPQGTCDQLLELLPNFAPDGAEPAAYGFDIEPIKYFAKDRYSSISAGLPNFLPVTTAGLKSAALAPKPPDSSGLAPRARRVSLSQHVFFPTVSLHDDVNSFFAAPDTYIWLHNRESLLSNYAMRMLQNIESIGNYWHNDYELLFDPDISMAENGRFVICLAMSSKNNDVARLALDALIAAVGDCRIGSNAFGEAMAALLPAGVITAVRWSRGLRDLSRTSLLHAHFAWQSISTLIEKASITPTQQIPFLELLVELQVDHRFKAGTALVHALSGSSGGGKSVKLAKTIVAFAGDDNGVRQSALQDLDARITRAERWQDWIQAAAHDPSMKNFSLARD